MSRQHIQKQRHYFADKGSSSQSYGFSSGHAWMWELGYKENWVWRIDAFVLWYWRRLLRVPWISRRSNQSILKEISPEYSLQGLMLKLILQSFSHLMQRLTHWKSLWCWKRLKAGEGGDRGWDGGMASPTQSTWVWANSGSWWWTGRPGVLRFMGSQIWTWLSDWTELNWCSGFPGGSVVKNLPAMPEHGFHPCVGKIPCWRSRQPTPAFLPGKSHGQRSLVGCSPWVT